MRYRLSSRQYPILFGLFFLIFTWILVDQFFFPLVIQRFIALSVVALSAITAFFFIVKPSEPFRLANHLGSLLGLLALILAVTSLGAPLWVDRLVMWQPVKRILRTALIGTCAPHCRFEMLSIYKAENLATAEVEAFSARIRKRLLKWS